MSTATTSLLLALVLAAHQSSGAVTAATRLSVGAVVSLMVTILALISVTRVPQPFPTAKDAWPTTSVSNVSPATLSLTPTRLVCSAAPPFPSAKAVLTLPTAADVSLASTQTQVTVLRASVAAFCVATLRSARSASRSFGSALRSLALNVLLPSLAAIAVPHSQPALSVALGTSFREVSVSPVSPR